MKGRASFAAGSKLKGLAVLVCLGLVTAVAWAGDRVLVPQEGPLPAYASGLGHTEPADGWVVTAFYYPVDTIPKNYNLFNRPVYDYPVGVVAPCVEGALTYLGEAVPQIVELWNAPGVRVPMWFTPKANWNGWTIKAMQKAGSLVGWADQYRETVRNSDLTDPKEPWHQEVVASGLLQDGRSFQVWSSHTPTLYSVRVEFGQ
jgi:hypothetical protein